MRNGRVSDKILSTAYENLLRLRGEQNGEQNLDESEQPGEQTVNKPVLLDLHREIQEIHKQLEVLRKEISKIREAQLAKMYLSDKLEAVEAWVYDKLEALECSGEQICSIPNKTQTLDTNREQTCSFSNNSCSFSNNSCSEINNGLSNSEQCWEQTTKTTVLGFKVNYTRTTSGGRGYYVYKANRTYSGERLVVYIGRYPDGAVEKILNYLRKKREQGKLKDLIEEIEETFGVKV